MEVDSGQRGAVRESLISDGGDRIGDDNLCQRGAVGESIFTDGGDPITNDSISQRVALEESIASDGGDRIGDDNLRQRSAVVESIVSDGCDRIGDDNLRQRGAPVESMVSDRGEFESKTVFGRPIIKKFSPNRLRMEYLDISPSRLSIVMSEKILSFCSKEALVKIDNPDSMEEVIYQPGQFGPVSTGWLDRVRHTSGYTDSALKAAQAALNGENPIGNCLYFDQGGSGKQIGAHYFH